MQLVLNTATNGLPSPSQCNSITFNGDDDDYDNCYSVYDDDNYHNGDDDDDE